LYGLGHLASGHSLKHLAAAVAGVAVCRMLYLRTLQPRTPAVGSVASGQERAPVARA
jgi:hypothetical protein